LGAESVFVGSGIFKSENPALMAKAIVEAVTYWDDPLKLAQLSTGLGNAIPGINVSELREDQKLALRGW